MKFYAVRFVTKKNGYTNWMIHIEATNAKEAKKKCEDLWYKKSDAHMFQIEAKLLKDDEEFLYHKFVKFNYVATENGLKIIVK